MTSPGLAGTVVASAKVPALNRVTVVLTLCYHLAGWPQEECRTTEARGGCHSRLKSAALTGPAIAGQRSCGLRLWSHR
jgi:hypothetical protein